MTYLILGDPSGHHTLHLIEQGIQPHDIYVWEDSTKGQYYVKMRGATVTDNLDTYVDMKFDVIIGNPPYQNPLNPARNNKLWHQFVLFALEHTKPGGIINLVTPSSIIGETGFSKKMHQLLSSTYNMTKIDYTSGQYFSVGVDICSWSVINEPYKGVTHVTHYEGTVEHNLCEGLPYNKSQMITQSIINKIDNSPHDRIPLVMGQSIPKESYCDTGEYEVFASGDSVMRTDVVPTTPECLKFVVPFSSSHTKRFVTSGHIGMLNCWCAVSDSEEASHLMSIIDHPVIDFFIRHYKRTSGFTPAIKNARVPMLDNLDNVAKEFNLTSEELNHMGVTVV